MGEAYKIIMDSCTNKGDVIVKDGNTSVNYNAGGLIGAAGVNQGSELPVQIKNCYNTGDVSSEFDKLISQGGLIGVGCGGNDIGSVKIENSYNVGKINVKGTSQRKGAIIGTKYKGELIVNNVYWLDSCGTDQAVGFYDVDGEVVDNMTVKNSKELSELTKTLGSEFKNDTGKNKGYPILNWE